MSKQQPTPKPTKKPVPAPVQPQKTAAQRPPAHQPQKTTTTTTQKAPVKKPAPAPVKPQNKSTVPAKTSTTATRAPAKPSTPAAKTPYEPPTQQPKTTQAKQLAQFTQQPAQSQQRAPQGEKADNWISRTVQSQVQRAGDYAGGFVNSIGDKVNKFGEGVGDSISNTTRGWGQGIAGYGNDMKDAVGVGGPRVATAGNPLGVAGMGSSKGTTTGGKAENSGVRNAGKGSGANPLGLS